jgi:hypothetical protein
MAKGFKKKYFSLTAITATTSNAKIKEQRSAVCALKNHNKTTSGNSPPADLELID